MTCPEIDNMYQSAARADYSKFLHLDKKQKLMLNDWFEYTWKMRELPIEEHRRGMLQGWALLQFIGEMTSGYQSETDWVTALIVNSDLELIFNNVMDNKKSLMRMYNKRFAQIWPVFSAADLIRQGISGSTEQTRTEVIAEYQKHSNVIHSPACWPRHLTEEYPPLPDWQHTLSTWYIVTKNIIDPNGWHPTEMDLRIVTNSFMSLIYFFKEGKIFFENPSLSPDIFDRTQVFSSL